MRRSWIRKRRGARLPQPIREYVIKKNVAKGYSLRQAKIGAKRYLSNKKRIRGNSKHNRLVWGAVHGRK